MRIGRVRTLASVALIGLLALAALGLRMTLTASGADSDRAAVAAVCERALRATQSLVLPPPQERGKRLSPAAAAAIKESGEQVLRELYVGSVLARRIGDLDHAVAEQLSGSLRVNDAGVSSLDCSNITLRGTTATVRAEVEIWADFAQVQDDGTVIAAHPVNIQLYTFSMVKVGDRWVIDGENWDFKPGYGP